MKRTELDKIFREKLYDYEESPMPGGWDAIETRLPVAKTVLFKPVWRYVVAAAVVSLLLVSSLVYLYDYERKSNVAVSDAEKRIEEKEPVVSDPIKNKQITEDKQSVAVLDLNRDGSKPIRKNVAVNSAQRSRALLANVQSSENGHAVSAGEDRFADEEASDNSRPEARNKKEKALRSRVHDSSDPAPDKYNMPKQVRKNKNGGWSFGMGAGSLGVGTDNSINAFTKGTTSYMDDRLALMNAVAAYKESPKTDIHHNTPLSFGVSVSKQLSDRFALQTGLSYTYLSSSWKTNGAYHADTKQKLHFLGIPISVVYKIAEWNEFMFYASAGIMGEINVAGKVNSELFYEKTKEISEMNDRVRMKDPLFSANARVGVSYPLFRFVSAFAEAGASYYFDNGSDIETIRSEKPFYANFQVGLRLGF